MHSYENRNMAGVLRMKGSNRTMRELQTKIVWEPDPDNTSWQNDFNPQWNVFILGCFQYVKHAFVQCKCIIHVCHVYSSRRTLFSSDVVHSFTQVCWRHHNATLSHSKCFWIGICSLSRKMESYGGLGIWKGHIWGPPRWVFTFRDKWSHWVPASCEWAPSAHTGFLNAHQNNLSKLRDTFHRRLMWGQIGNHFNKIPLGWNCISQKSKRLPDQGETQGNTNSWRFTWSF